MIKAHAITSKLQQEYVNFKTIMAQTLPFISESKQEKKLTMITQLPLYKDTDVQHTTSSCKCSLCPQIVALCIDYASKGSILTIKSKVWYLISVFQRNKRSIYHLFKAVRYFPPSIQSRQSVNSKL